MCIYLATIFSGRRYRIGIFSIVFYPNKFNCMVLSLIQKWNVLKRWLSKIQFPVTKNIGDWICGQLELWPRKPVTKGRVANEICDRKFRNRINPSYFDFKFYNYVGSVKCGCKQSQHRSQIRWSFSLLTNIYNQSKSCC